MFSKHLRINLLKTDIIIVSIAKDISWVIRRLPKRTAHSIIDPVSLEAPSAEYISSDPICHPTNGYNPDNQICQWEIVFSTSYFDFLIVFTPATEACGSFPVLTFKNDPVPIVSFKLPGWKQPDPYKDAAWSAIYNKILISKLFIYFISFIYFLQNFFNSK